MVRTTIKLEGAGRISAKLNGQKFWIEPLGDTLQKLAEYGEAEAHKRAPHGETGNTDRAITNRVDRHRPARYAQVVLKATTAADGFRYDFALDAAKHRKARGTHYTRAQKRALAPKRVTKANAPYHYASGTREGRSTYQWFRGVSSLMRRRLRSAAKDLAAQMQRNWGKR